MEDRIYSGIAGVVLAGGMSRRMGFDKALVPWRGKPLVSYPLELLSGFFREVVIIARNSGDYSGLGFPVHGDLIQARGSLVGLYSGLNAVEAPLALFTACDMPLVTAPLVELIISSFEDGVLAVVPESEFGPEPLLALYSKKCLPLMERLITSGDLKISRLFDSVPVKFIPVEKVREADPHLSSFINVNSAEELEKLAGYSTERTSLG